MDTVPNPFEDPEVAEALRQAGIVHKPGMAAEMLGELAPLLAGEGIDLNDPHSIPDLDHLNAALARATQQYNMRLFTPVHAERDAALTVLIEFTEALEARNTRRAETVLGSVEPEATAHRPAASHVIGAGLGLLDTWYTDTALTEQLGEVTVPQWRGPARSTASRLLTLARRGEAYDSLDTLIARHGGEFAMVSIMLAVAATLLTHSQRTGDPLVQTTDTLFSHSGGPRGSGGAFGAEAASSAADHALAEAYRGWLADDIDADMEDLETELTLFQGLVAISRAVGADLSDPGDIEELLDALFEHPDERATTTMLLVLDRYVHFRLDEHPIRWAAAHDAVEEALRDAVPEFTVLNEAIAAAQQIPEEERAAALGATRVISAVRPLLEWMGESVPVTAAGNLRRADLKAAGALLGIHTRGVNRIPDTPWRDTAKVRGADPDDVVHALSLGDVPVLSSWWQALAIMDVIEIQRTRARPGPRAEEFLTAGDPAGIDAAEMLTAIFVAEVITHRLSSSIAYNQHIVDALITLMTDALDPDHVPAPPDPDAPPFSLAGTTDFLETRILDHVGLITRDGDRITVPDPLQAAVGIGVIMAMNYINELPDEESDD